MSQRMTDESIYMIFRVFSMTTASIGAKLYVDPNLMKTKSLLKFTGTWAVTPVSGKAPTRRRSNVNADAAADVDDVPTDRMSKLELYD